ncbi:hypothetical protein [Myroides guanonis]|uniref:Uncharacterized protein n=1 Tax=Myroides guanonis TaxID=1150112 RepID=A0A1I3PPN8_9FLAO|nr:hypothetical protein [Myroides guanonis]SFJ23409.1 hypothetical protein SAMN04487893_104198 [Myroides guanonis]
MSFGYTFSTVNIKNTMHTYIHKNLLDTSKHFFEKFNKTKTPPRFRTRRSDAIFFKLLEFHYCILLDFCCRKQFLNTTIQGIETIHTFSGYMSYQNLERKVKNISAQPITASKTLLKIQNKLQKLLETSLQTSSETYKTFYFQLTPAKTNTPVFGIYYKDEKDKSEITSVFKKNYSNTLLGQYKSQRFIYELELPLYTEYDYLQIVCHYKYDRDFYRDLKKIF